MKGRKIKDIWFRVTKKCFGTRRNPNDVRELFKKFSAKPSANTGGFQFAGGFSDNKKRGGGNKSTLPQIIDRSH